MSKGFAKVIVNTPLGSVEYDNVNMNNIRAHEGTLIVGYIEDAKMSKQIWFGPGYWHNMTVEEER